MFNRMDQNMNGGPADAVIGKIDDAQRGDGESGGFFSKHGDGEEFHIPGDTYMIFMEGIEGAECHGIGFQKDGLRGLVHAAVRFGRLHSASDGSVAAYDMIRLYKDPQFGTGGQECLGTAAHSDIRMVGDDNRSLPISFFFK